MALTVPLTIYPTRVPETPEEAPIPPTVYEKAYAKVAMVRASPQYSGVLVAWYADAAARENEEQPVMLREFASDLETLTGDIYPSSYAWLKTLPEFEGAIDC